jgi:hypothetical protein
LELKGRPTGREARRSKENAATPVAEGKGTALDKIRAVLIEAEQAVRDGEHADLAEALLFLTYDVCTCCGKSLCVMCTAPVVTGPAGSLDKIRYEIGQVNAERRRRVKKDKTLAA